MPSPPSEPASAAQAGAKAAVGTPFCRILPVDAAQGPALKCPVSLTSPASDRPSLALAQCTKVDPGAAGLARLHYDTTRRGLEHGREQAQGPRSCTHGRGERPRTWPRDRVSVFCHVLSCRLNTCVHVCMFLPSHSAETVPDEPLPACQPSRIAPLPSASSERTGCARPALSIPSETLPGGRLPANRNQNLREKRRCAPARRQKVNSPEFLAICGRASSSRRRRHDSDAVDRPPFRQGISGAARQATAPLLMTIGRRAGSL